MPARFIFTPLWTITTAKPHGNYIGWDKCDREAAATEAEHSRDRGARMGPQDAEMFASMKDGETRIMGELKYTRKG